MWVLCAAPSNVCVPIFLHFVSFRICAADNRLYPFRKFFPTGHLKRNGPRARNEMPSRNARGNRRRGRAGICAIPALKKNRREVRHAQRKKTFARRDVPRSRPQSGDRAAAAGCPRALKPRARSADQVRQIAASIRVSGFTGPVLFAGGNTIIAGAGARAKPRYSLIALKEFRHRLMRQAVPVRHLGRSHADIQIAARKAVCSTGEIVTLIVEGGLDWVGFTNGQRTYRNLVVDVDEVMSKLHTTVVAGHTKKEMKSLLGVNDCVIKWLCDSGYLPLRKSRSPTSRKSQSVARQEDLDSFNLRYVTLRNLARQSKFNSQRLKPMLKQASVEPLDRSNENGRNIYRREIVEQFLNKISSEPTLVDEDTDVI